ncbi:tyrosine-type recombinase/integrase [Aquabacterium sp. OR-4]|uniref:tyrosine-type recombinase/integrase n=1 Tax=Aquabacterium sp. OR-4 TaxID=2978127 RepID=UPI0021B3B270|nr:tyrosine-type recombinase/integrase [Aquabacterium sp. OR-4]MDT7835021.1 tyrosine-type recombinase/integrase [Aquabacterium sp. OR-4]
MTRSDLPRRVYERHGAWYYVTPAAGKWVKLARVSDGLPAMYRALARLTDSEATSDRMPAVISRWLEAKRGEWSAGHAQDQERIADRMGKAFAEFTPAEVTTPVCAQYLKTYATQARTHNQHRTMLSQVLAFAAIEGLREGHNPVANIPPKRLLGRVRIVTDDEVRALKAAALQQSRNGEALVKMIELALLTGQRISDVIGMRWQDVSDQGVTVVQDKGQGRVRLLIEMTPALRAAVDACAEGTHRIGHLLKTQSGSGYTYAGIRSAWVRACARAGITDLHIHDLRGRAGVDAIEATGTQDVRAAQRLLGHKGEAMTRHYTEGKYAKRVKPAR